MSEYPEDIMNAARKQCDLAGVTPHSDMRVHCEYVAAAAILDERERCIKICAAEREWGGNVRDVQNRIENGSSERKIAGWNCSSEDESDDA
jgi:hypothetical protein